MSEWQPIETAPKDGQTILVCRDCHHDDYHAWVATAFWGDRYAGTIADDPKNYIWANWNEGMDENDIWAECTGITHWMPLPPPPK